MLFFRYWTRFLIAFLNKFKLFLILGTFFGIIAFLVTTQVAQIFPVFSRGEKIGIVGRFTTDTLPLSIQSEVSLGLTILDEENNALPGLSDSWEYQEEGKTWIFKLKEGITWQDGTKIKAKDIKYNFNDVAVEILDDKTLKFSLKDPFSPFPSVVSRPVFKKGLLGAGLWKVSKISYVAGSGSTLESLKLVNTKDFKSKLYKFYPSEESAHIALKLAEVNKLLEMVDPKDLANWKTLSITAQTRENLYTAIFINTQDSIFSDKSARQALAYALNKDNFNGKRATGPLAPFSWGYNPQVKRYEYNVNRANELLDTLPKEQRKDLSIKLVTIPTLLPIADKIKEDWEKVGVKTQIQVSNTTPTKFQALLAIQAIPPDPDQYSFWHSTQEATNITQYKNAKESQRIDKLLEDGRRTLDQDERRKIYLDFQRFLVEDVPAIFLYHPITYTISKK